VALTLLFTFSMLYLFENSALLLYNVEMLLTQLQCNTIQCHFGRYTNITDLIWVFYTFKKYHFCGISIWILDLQIALLKYLS
jgi:hypothetical protein